jgi:hypothetical protein
VVVEIVDTAGRVVPAGVPGELWIGGRGIARGYRHRGQLTLEKFRTLAGQRLYRSGDLALLRDDGELEFLGRLDDQLKIRGFRIEPAEIEGHLLDHPAVSMAAVAERAGQLVGYVVLGAGGEGSLGPRAAEPTGSVPGPPDAEQHRLAAELQAHLAARLPRHMVPTRFEFLSELPLTTSGKIDRRALPAPAERHIDDTPGGLEPRSRTEADLQRIFAGLLRLPTVGLHDDFFELGGHSLLAAQLISRVRSRLGRELPISAVFDAPTVSRMAAMIEEDAASTPARPAIPRRSRAQFQTTLRSDGTVRVDARLRKVLNLDLPPSSALPDPFVAGPG